MVFVVFPPSALEAYPHTQTISPPLPRLHDTQAEAGQLFAPPASSQRGGLLSRMARAALAPSSRPEEGAREKAAAVFWAALGKTAWCPVLDSPPVAPGRLVYEYMSIDLWCGDGVCVLCWETLLIDTYGDFFLSFFNVELITNYCENTSQATFRGRCPVAQWPPPMHCAPCQTCGLPRARCTCWRARVVLHCCQTGSGGHQRCRRWW